MRKTLLFVLLSYVMVSLIYVTSYAIPLASLTLVDYRLEAGKSLAASMIWMFVIIPVCLISMGGIMSYLLGSQIKRRMTRAERLQARRASSVSMAALICFAVVVGVPYGFYFFWIVLPALALDERMHLTDWPADLRLSSFTVCPTKLYQRDGHTNADGEITVEVVNTSSELLKEAIFTVETGGYWSDNWTYGTRLRILNVQSNERRRLVLPDYIGTILAGVKGGGTHYYSANIYWDAVYFASGSAPRLTERPANTQFKIVSCLPSQQ